MPNYSLVNDLEQYVNGLKEDYPELTTKEVLDIAVKLQYNKLFSEAFVAGFDAPSAFEAIAIALGYKAPAF